MQRKSLFSPVMAALSALAVLLALSAFADPSGVPQGPVGAMPEPAQTGFMSDDELDKVVLPTNLPPDRKDFFGLVYSGYRQSAIDPCGCVKNKLGGIDRDARVLERLEKLGVPMVKVDAGGFLKLEPNEQALRRTRAMFRAWQMMGMDAVNVGAVDLNQGLAFLRDAQTSWSVPFVSANLVSASDRKPVFEPYRVVTVKTPAGAEVRVGIIGLTRPPDGQTSVPVAQAAGQLRGALAAVGSTPEARRWVVDVAGVTGSEPTKGLGADSPAAGAEQVLTMDPLGSLLKYLPELREKSDTIVLLDYQKIDAVNRLVEALPAGHGITAAVAGEFIVLLPLPQELNGVKVAASGFEGRQLGNLMIEFKDGRVGRRDNALIPVSEFVRPVDEYTQMMDEARRETSAVPVANTEGVAMDKRNISYIGAAACAECHKAEYDQWRLSPHATAFASLVKKGEQFNESCVKCHVTGYKVDNGFSDFRATPEFANVQCEVCHGPSYDHVVQQRRAKIMARMGRGSNIPETDKAVLNMKFDANFCAACHNPQNDPHFDFERDIRFVDHSQVAQRPKDFNTTKPAALEPDKAQ